MRSYSCPRSYLELIFEWPRPAGIANQIAAQHARDVSVRLPLISVGGVEGRAASTGTADEDEQYQDHAENHRENLQIRIPRYAKIAEKTSNPDQGPILLEHVNRSATGQASRNKFAQFVRIRFRIKEPGAKERDELTKLVSR